MSKSGKKDVASKTGGARIRGGHRYTSEPIEYSTPGFSEREAGEAASDAMPEGSGLTPRQQALRELLLKTPAGEAMTALETEAFSPDDGIEVALDSLRRSNVIAEEMIRDSARMRRQFERRSRRIDAKLLESGRKLAELVGDEP